MNTGGLPLTKTEDGFIWALGLGLGMAALAYWILHKLGVAPRKAKGHR